MCSTIVWPPNSRCLLVKQTNKTKRENYTGPLIHRGLAISPMTIYGMGVCDLHGLWFTVCDLLLHRYSESRPSTWEFCALNNLAVHYPPCLPAVSLIILWAAWTSRWSPPDSDVSEGRRYWQEPFWNSPLTCCLHQSLIYAWMVSSDAWV